MSPRLIVIGLVLAACSHPHAQRKLEPTPATQPRAAAEADAAPATLAVDFARGVRPILESRCQPCHFPGGRMYDRLPFDKPETIRELGERLFTRIKAENEQAVIRQFLAQPQ
jgi:hypothetical protein